MCEDFSVEHANGDDGEDIDCGIAANAVVVAVVTVTVAEESEYIDSVKITGMEGVSTVTVSVGEEVKSFCSIKIRFSS